MDSTGFGEEDRSCVAAGLRPGARGALAEPCNSPGTEDSSFIACEPRACVLQVLKMPRCGTGLRRQVSDCGTPGIRALGCANGAVALPLLHLFGIRAPAFRSLLEEAAPIRVSVFETLARRIRRYELDAAR